MKEKLARYSENQGKNIVFKGDSWEQYTSLNEESYSKFYEKELNHGGDSRCLSENDRLLFSFDHKNIYIHSIQTQSPYKHIQAML
jgi:hypothetical protein